LIWRVFIRLCVTDGLFEEHWNRLRKSIRTAKTVKNATSN
jgi:hypothetical protein